MNFLVITLLSVMVSKYEDLNFELNRGYESFWT